MVEGKSLSSDLNLLKELEELKLKQKLLVGSLKKKHKSDEFNLLLEISNKLDFIVQIFQDTQKEEGEEKDLKINDVLGHILENKNKQEEFEKNIDQRFSSVENLLLDLKTQMLKNEEHKSTLDKDLTVNNLRSETLPPAPEFKVISSKSVN